jgi:DNA polymerase I
MTDGSQHSLGDFDDGDDEPRVTAEAAAIAGSDGGEASVVDPDDHRFPPVEETVELAVTQVDYTIAGRGDDEAPIVHVFGRIPGEDGDDPEAVHARVHGFTPYFYAPVDSVSEDRLREYDAITGWDYEDDAGEPFESIRGERLLKIYGRTPRDVGQIRDDFDHFEADILFPNRFLIDKDVTSGITVPARRAEDGSLRIHHEEVQPADVTAEPRVSIFDIEVDDRQGFPEDGEETMISLTAHDSYDDPRAFPARRHSRATIPSRASPSTWTSAGSLPKKRCLRTFSRTSTTPIRTSSPGGTSTTSTRPTCWIAWRYSKRVAPTTTSTRIDSRA